jgi:hypothetical protein
MHLRHSPLMEFSIKKGDRAEFQPTDFRPPENRRCLRSGIIFQELVMRRFSTQRGTNNWFQLLVKRIRIAHRARTQRSRQDFTQPTPRSFSII